MSRVPITIEWPVPNPPNIDLLGWGTLVHASTDFIGPLPADAFWTVESWLVTDAEHFAVRQRYPCTDGAILRRYIGEAGQQDTRTNGQQDHVFGPRQQQDVVLRVQLDAPSTGFHEQVQIPSRWDENSQLGSLFAVAPSTIGAGFDVSDRELLQKIYEAVYRTFTV